MKKGYWEQILEAIQKMIYGKIDIKIKEMEMNFDDPEYEFK